MEWMGPHGIRMVMERRNSVFTNFKIHLLKCWKLLRLPLATSPPKTTMARCSIPCGALLHVETSKVGFVTSVVCLALVVLPGLVWGILTPLTSGRTDQASEEDRRFVSPFSHDEKVDIQRGFFSNKKGENDERMKIAAVYFLTICQTHNLLRRKAWVAFWLVLSWA